MADISQTGNPAASETDLPFRQLAQDLPTPCWISDAEGFIVWVNAAWLAYTGMDVEAIRTSGLEQLHDPAVLPSVRTRWAAALAAGQPEEMMFPLRGRDGHLRPFLTRVVPLRDASGAVRRWFGTNTDISAQSNAEAMLRESQDRLDLATQAAQLGVWDWDLVSNTFVYSERARQICGLPSEGEITFADVVAVTHPEDYPRTSAIARRATDPNIRSTEPYNYRIVRPDGVVRWVQAYGRAVFAASGGEERAVRYVGTLQDVTEHFELSQSLRENEALLRNLFDASQLFIAVLEVTDDSFRYILANRATTTFYSLPADTRNFDAREIGVPAAEIAQWRETLLDVWQSGAPRTMEYAFDGGEGPRWYIGTYSPLPAGPEGRPRISFVVIDVTIRKQAEDQQTLLMREVDHRAKNVLAVVQAIVQLTAADDTATFKRAVQGRIGSLARAHTLLASERWTGADLQRLIEEELAPFATDRSSRLTIKGPPHALNPAAAQSMALIVHELATNAAKHGSLAGLDGDLVVSWTVNPQGLELIWREVSGQPAAPAGRRGFGFTMLEQSIARQLRGKWTTEWAPTGLVCTISLPQHQTDPDSEPSDAPRRTNVLIVEDEPLIAMALADDLDSLGYAGADRAASKQGADAMIRSATYSLALLDINLAGETTFDLAERLKAKGTKIVFCTGYQSTVLPPSISDAQILVKPIQREALAEVIRAIRGSIDP